MKIILRSLSIVNFKGIKSLNIEFGNETNVFGRNASGKSTIFDAWCWLLFGKDSNDSKAFEIKPLDKHGKSTDQVENEVTAILDIDGRTTTIKKIQRESWVKKRGSAFAEFTGNENVCYWNDVPLKVGEFQAKISDLLKEDVFKLITNPHYFNVQMKWQDRRAVLMSIAGEISNSELAASRQDFAALLDALSNKTLSEYKKEISAKKKKLKDDLESIPARIDEINRNIPEALDWESLERMISTKKARIADIDHILTDVMQANATANKRKLDKQNEIYNLQAERNALANSLRKEWAVVKPDFKGQIAAIEKTIREKNMESAGYADSITAKKAKIESHNVSMAKLRANWDQVNSTELDIDEHEFNCPTCRRALEPGDIESKRAEMIENFNIKKNRQLSEITADGMSYKAQVEKLNAEIAQLQKDIELVEYQLPPIQQKLEELKNSQQEVDSTTTEDIEPKIAAWPAIVGLDNRILAAKQELEDMGTQEENVGYKQEKSDLETEVSNYTRQLGTQAIIESSKKRISELEELQKTMSQSLADLEKTEFTIEAFTKAKIDAMEQRINGKFKYASFKMFNTLINGGVEEACETTYNGVPYSNLNTAGKMLVGIDIINVLCEHYNVVAPIFIDNRESITDIPETDGQVINLVVSPVDTTLRVKSDKKELSAVA